MLIDLYDMMNGDDGGGVTKEDLLGRLVIITMIDSDPSKRMKKYTQAWCLVKVIDGETGELLDPGFEATGNLASQMMAVPTGDSAGGRVVRGRNSVGGWWGFDFVKSAADRKSVAEAYHKHLEMTGEAPF